MTLQAKQLTRTHISSFVHSLHLLDLDLLDDWPGVSKETFDSKSNLQQRLRCVEWSLYRLFELYDLRTTREKLLPFFPPATSLQSINLRAALFRQLTELKKDGRLGQNVVLRKTMLDECKGDKFEELVAAFSILVLKKVRKQHTIGNNGVLNTRSENLLPLIISHRKVVEQDLVKRKELRLKAERQQQSLQAELKRLAVEESETKRLKAPKISADIDSLQRIVHENWIGDMQWADALLYGQRPDADLKNFTANGILNEYDDGDEQPTDVLHDLSTRVSFQNARLSRWQKCLKDLKENQVVEIRRTDKPVRSIETTSFSQHQSLKPDLNPEDRKRLTLIPEHAALLGSLNKDLTRSKKIQKAPMTALPQVEGSSKRAAMSGQAGMLVTSEREMAPDFTNTGTISAQSREFEDTNLLPVARVGSSASHHSSAERQEYRPKTPPQSLHDSTSLLERTKASLAHLISHENEASMVKQPITIPSDAADQAVIAPGASMRPDRSSLLDRTRESMSLLTSAFEDGSRRSSSARKSMHSKSKSVNVVSQTRRLDSAWSQQPKAPKTARDDFDVHADYDSVFKSRPKLAMSPNLSPQRNDLFNELLEEGMKKLTIESGL